MNGYRFTTIGDEARLRDLAVFDASAYGEKDVPLDVLRAWWHAFPIGVRILEDPTGRIAGAMSGWPLHRATYDAIVTGTITEDTIAPSDFELTTVERPRWYISGIAVTPEVRALPRLLLAFLADGLAALGEASRCARPDMCAVATSAEGARMLHRFGFTRAGATPHGIAYEQRGFRDSRITALAQKIEREKALAV